MSDQNKTVLRRIFEELFNDHRLELIPELYADNCMSCDPANDRDMQGMDDLLMLLEGYRTTFPNHKYTVHNIISDGDFGCVRWSVDLDTKSTDRRLNIDGMSLCKFEDGKVSAVWQHWDNLGFLKEMGAVSPETSVAATVEKLSA